MTTDCLRLDDYLDSRLPEPDAEAFEAHTLTCTDCDAALDTASGLDLSPLRAASCPPADRALVASARRSRFRLPLVALALAAVVVLAIGLARIAAPDIPTPVVAEQTLPPAPPEEAPVPEPEAAPLAETPELEATPEPTAPSAPRPAPEQTAPRPALATPTPAIPPTPEATAPPRDAIAETDPQTEEDLSPEAVEAAQRDIALAFSLVAEAHTRAGDTIRTRAGSVSETIDQTLPF